MKAASIIIFIIFNLPVYSQIISGTVYDNDTRKPFPGASVFFNGTTAGTYTNQYGSFRLVLPDNQKLPIAITSIGYNSVLEQAYSVEDSLTIFMTTKVYELGEVHVYSKMSLRERINRNKYLYQFKEQFLGTSAYARSCEILNEKDLVFQYSRESGILKA